MNEPKDCPFCFGSGKIRITDYIDHALRDNWPVECPLCLGTGVINLTQALLGYAR